jgi:hypothetical protein
MAIFFDYTGELHSKPAASAAEYKSADDPRGDYRDGGLVAIILLSVM